MKPTGESLSEMQCHCGAKMHEVIHAAENMRRGWLCIECLHFERAIYRERKIEKSESK